jgi:hypothetical protein
MVSLFLLFTLPVFFNGFDEALHHIIGRIGAGAPSKGTLSPLSSPQDFPGLTDEPHCG